MGDRLDLDRVHFLGKVAYRDYLNLLRLSSAHLYLTYPFVLSWSMLEAMALGCLVIGSDTAPVQEVIQDGVNGLLVPFFQTQALAERVIEVLEAPERFRDLRAAARATICDRYDFERHQLAGPSEAHRRVRLLGPARGSAQGTGSRPASRARVIAPNHPATAAAASASVICSGSRSRSGSASTAKARGSK